MGAHYTAAVFIEAIPGTGGIISTIASRVGCDWHTAKKYCTRETTPHVTVAQAYEDECSMVLDLAESVVISELRKRDIATAKWYLSKKGKHRGYADKQEVELGTKGDGGGFKVQFVSNVDDDKL